eukprot:CAMPEP_0172324518 /NCGR_PEP_ID=MMETSP1058-20130122/51563_1 /TAXON_ID=83371 /ORGANISM="Detonula confervacea, Strain CCMP 353" /LENGTH=302 /DNA_ID=CAMNT_0013040813 /DNA_START=86 /DNA_END=994 /DNA_ORIENTATION=+
MSTIHSRAFAKAPPLSSLLRRMSISSRDCGALRSATTLLPNRNTPSLSNLQRSPGQKMYSSLASSSNGLLSPSRNESQHAQKASSYSPIQNTIRTNFSYAGPRKLSDVLKTELLEGKSHAEICDMWMTYHEGKEKVHGLLLDEAKGKSILARAAQCPFFIHPVFREEGHFMIISQFQAPNYFLLAFLEDYRMDPARAQPLLTISLFDDMAKEKDVTLVRCDIINQGIQDDEGYNICKHLLDDYFEEDNFRDVHMFNKKPDAFDVDAFVKEKEQQWKADSDGGGDTGDEVIEATAENKTDNAV